MTERFLPLHIVERFKRFFVSEPIIESKNFLCKSSVKFIKELFASEEKSSFPVIGGGFYCNPLIRRMRHFLMTLKINGA